jgi:hypothetical protein
MSQKLNDDQKYILSFLQEIYRKSDMLNCLDAIKLLFVNESDNLFIANARKTLTREQADEVAFLFANWVMEERTTSNRRKILHEIRTFSEGRRVNK